MKNLRIANGPQEAYSLDLNTEKITGGLDLQPTFSITPMLTPVQSIAPKTFY